MFAMAVRRMATARQKQIHGFSHEHINLGSQFVCDCYYDNTRFRLKSDQDHLRLVDTAFADHDVIRISLTKAEGHISKTTMFGLPIYYAFLDSGILISTRARWLQALGAKLEEDPRVMPEYFVYRYVTPPKTLFKDVNCIPIGGTLKFCYSGDKVTVNDLAWTNVFDLSAQPLTFDESVERCAEDLRKGMQALAPDREQVGCLLSGGVDSSMLFKLAKDYLSLGESHSTGYPFENQVNNGEKIYAQAAADTFGSTHHYHAFTSRQFLHALIDSVDHAEIPVIHLQSVLLELVFDQALGTRNRIVLNGQGADGIFGSTMMWWYQKYRWLFRFPFNLMLGVLGQTPANRSFPYRRLYGWSKMDWSLNLAKTNHAIWMMGQVGEKSWVKSFYRVDDQEITRNRLETVGQFQPQSVLDAFSMLDFVSDIDMTQIIWGQIASAHNRRVHYSFNSPGLIRAAVNTSWKDKLAEQKRLGRAVAARLGVPQSILSRPKLSFGIPSARWAGPGGVIEPVLKVISPVVDVKLLMQFQGSDEKLAMIYWNWINYGLWKRMVIGDESKERLHTELDIAIAESASAIH